MSIIKEEEEHTFLGMDVRDVNTAPWAIGDWTYTKYILG